MRKHKLNWNLISYELMNVIGNWYIPFFGMIFPVLLGLLLGLSVFKDVPEQVLPEVLTTFVLTMLNLVPLAVVFLGHASIYSQEQEQKIPLRLQLFGISPSDLMWAKMIAFAIVMAVGLAIDLLILGFVLKIKAPKPAGLLVVVLSLYGIAGALFMLAHGVANRIRKFGPTYSIVMVLYFTFMILGGSMGLQPNDFPPVMKQISSVMPFQYISSDFYAIWAGQPYNYAPFLQGLIFLTDISALIMLYSFMYRRNRASL